MTNVKKITKASCLVAMGLTLSSCELIGPQLSHKLPLEPVKSEQPGVVFKELQNKAPTEAKPSKPELFPSTSQFVPEAAPHKKAKGEGSYSLNFDDADLGEVAKVVLSDILGQNYVLSPKVTGKVTLQTTEALTKDELLPTLEMVLRMNNAVLAKDGKIYHIEPAAEALYSSTFSAPGSAGGSGYQTKVIPVRNVGVEDIVKVIKPLVQEKTILTVDGTRNILVASGTPDELARVSDMVRTFDIDVLKGRSFGLFPLSHVEPETLIKELEEVFDKKEKGEESEFFRFIPINRLNSVLAITHQARYLQDIESWIFRLDKANTESGGGVNVYKVQHSDAEELAGTLNEIFTGAQPADKSAKVSPGKKAAEATNKQPGENKTDTAKTTNRTARRSGGSGATGSETVANVEDVKIIADKANNSLVIVSSPREYEIILPIIMQLDALPLQVLIDAKIVSVDLKDDLKYGIQWFLDHGGSSIGSGNNAVSLGQVATATGTAFATGGLSAIYNSGVVNALLSAQAAKNNINVISSPSLMVLNNQQAKINVGDQVPIQTSTTSVPIAGGATTPSIAVGSSIQYKDTGVTLDVTPRVNANGMVIMEIKQIVSNVVPQTNGVTSTATINKKEIESSVAVLDGETIVLGGLITEDNRDIQSGIPLLHDVPVIGPLFGQTIRNKDRTELVVLITPRVVKSKQDSRLISDEFKRKLTGIYQSGPAPAVYIQKPTVQ
ncbi:type II secretion system secretin GspD [Candidatus Methylobacter oryzae]|uniref:Type II secretion system protein GspD n=1 Tax=Candidatus Methylobacter oryzae TaxID=2497749 RepID=A0ABY3C5G1_9GAMM|nr:type II secretion system secretin GspD [Candidatus Methylobacter oryzae]TRW90258.1 type II secretion system protein GspD [Candidatus Methylobacter oryzae]